MSAAALTRLSEFDQQELANMAWACAKQQLKDKAFLTALASHVGPNLLTFEPTQLSRIAWAFAKLN